MAVPSNTFQTYQSVGNREDLIDIITNLDPVDTWFTSNTGSTRAIATYHEWQTDVLASPAANAQVEGDDFAAASVTPTTRLGNYTQILAKVFQITETQQAVVAAGRTDEVDYQTVKKTKELARDIEYALLLNTTAAAGSSTTARTLKGAVGWITTNTYTGTAIDMTEPVFNANLSAIWTAGGHPSVTLVGGYQKQKISAFTSNSRRIEAEDRKIVNAVDVYESDFGIVQVVKSHILNDFQPGYVLNLGDMDLWCKAWLRPTSRIQLAKTGSSDKYKIEGELTLECRNQKGSGLLTGLKSS